MTEYSFYNCIRYWNTKTRQSICSSQHATCKDDNSVANAEINIAGVANAKAKTQLQLTCEVFHFVYKIHQISPFSIVLMLWHERFPTNKHGCRKVAGI